MPRCSFVWNEAWSLDWKAAYRVHAAQAPRWRSNRFRAQCCRVQWRAAGKDQHDSNNVITFPLSAHKWRCLTPFRSLFSEPGQPTMVFMMSCLQMRSRSQLFETSFFGAFMQLTLDVSPDCEVLHWFTAFLCIGHVSINKCSNRERAYPEKTEPCCTCAQPPSFSLASIPKAICLLLSASVTLSGPELQPAHSRRLSNKLWGENYSVLWELGWALEIAAVY